MAGEGHGVVMGDNAGKYQLIAQLGEVYPYRVSVAFYRGATGDPRLALVRHPLPGVLGEPHERARLLRDVRQLARAEHPNLVAIYDVDDDPLDPSFVSEYLEGQLLASVLAASKTVRNAFPHRILLRMIAEILSGLAHLHELRGPTGSKLNLVHGSIHPGNVVVTYDGIAKVVGLEGAGARADWRREAPTDTVASSYAAPEQLNGSPVDARADLFAVGLIIWEIVARQPLFTGGPEGIRSRLAEGPLPSISSFVRGVPDALQAILDRALRIDPAERYASAADMLRDVERYLGSTGRPLAREQIAERVRAVFAEDAKKAKQCTASWLRAAASGDGAATSLGEMGPGGWLGAAPIRPPSLPAAPQTFPAQGAPFAGPYADYSASPSGSLMLVPTDDLEQMTPRRSRLMLGIAIGAVLAFVILGAIMTVGLAWRFAASSDQQPSAPAPSAVVPVAPAAPPQHEETAPTPRSATVKLESEPPEATVEWQGQVVGRTVPLGIQYFAISRTGYKRQDVVVDTSVTAGPEGFSTKVLLEAEPKPRRATPAKRPVTVDRRDEANVDRALVTPPRPPPPPPKVVPTPRIRAIEAEAPVIRTIDGDSARSGRKIKVIDDD